ncbi:hypothetical protein AC578_5468 [Pseudocercospora eumusae]|uniref:Uncharacterized protein n=1 Tax=Pseudocercospora eumusae TaxID=321146 RepID=A0A139HK75_9PEZI|nr:hypothetical protein AC578_5468 [Pseudocercospora eumusae]
MFLAKLFSQLRWSMILNTKMNTKLASHTSRQNLDSKNFAMGAGFRYHFLPNQEKAGPDANAAQQNAVNLEEICRQGVRNAVDRLNEQIRRRKTNAVI